MTRTATSEVAPFDPRAFIAQAPWCFAKTMASIPHEYVVEGKVPDDEGFQQFMAHIAARGYRARWRHCGRTATSSSTAGATGRCPVAGPTRR